MRTVKRNSRIGPEFDWSSSSVHHSVGLGPQISFSMMRYRIDGEERGDCYAAAVIGPLTVNYTYEAYVVMAHTVTINIHLFRESAKSLSFSFGWPQR